MLNLAAGLALHGYPIDLVLAQAEGPYMEQIPKSVRVVELNVRHRRSFRTLYSLPALLRYLRHERPHALLSGLNANFVALWARRITGIPQRLVISEHNTFSRQNEQLPGGYRRLMVQLVRYCYPWADGIVAVSKGVAEDLAQVSGIGRDRIHVIYNPIVTPELEAKTKDLLKHPWFDSSEPPVVLSVGRLTVQKDFGTLIEAFARLRQTRAARLLILGEGEERPMLEARVRKFALEKDVQFPGFVPNPYPYMAQAALFVLSSKWEGLPTVLVEALYCGAPVVSTDCPSGPSEILQDGRYGQLVEVGNVASLAQAMEKMLDNTTSAPARESWQPFELETVVDQYMRILLGI